VHRVLVDDPQCGYNSHGIHSFPLTNNDICDGVKISYQLVTSLLIGCLVASCWYFLKCAEHNSWVGLQNDIWLLKC